MIDEQNIGFADFRGNRQYISVGNINSVGKASLILLDYAARRRLKIWATARVIDAGADPELAQMLTPSDYDADVERMLVFTIAAFDWNCPQHITPRYTESEIERELMKNNPGVIQACGHE